MKNKLLLGNILGISAFIIWGFMPLYWKLLSRMESLEIIVHRITLSFVLLLVFFLITKRTRLFEIFKDKQKRKGIIVCAFMLLINWSIFIFATMADRVLECSLAYYINPIIVIAFGMLFLKEPIGKVKLLSILLALIGVLVLIFGYNQVPYFAILIAFSFSIYGLVKKRMGLDPFIGLFLEMLVLLPVAICMQIFQVLKGITVYNGGIDSVWFVILIILTGFLTVLPLTLYNKSITMISLGNSGFIQFITPTMMFFIGVFVNGELFTTSHLISFIFIWLAVIIFCISLVYKSRVAAIES